MSSCSSSSKRKRFSSKYPISLDVNLLKTNSINLVDALFQDQSFYSLVNLTYASVDKYSNKRHTLSIQNRVAITKDMVPEIIETLRIHRIITLDKREELLSIYEARKEEIPSIISSLLYAASYYRVRNTTTDRASSVEKRASETIALEVITNMFKTMGTKSSSPRASLSPSPPPPSSSLSSSSEGIVVPRLRRGYSSNPNLKGEITSIGGGGKDESNSSSNDRGGRDGKEGEVITKKIDREFSSTPIPSSSKTEETSKQPRRKTDPPPVLILSKKKSQKEEEVEEEENDKKKEDNNEKPFSPPTSMSLSSSSSSSSKKTRKDRKRKGSSCLVQ